MTQRMLDRLEDISAHIPAKAAVFLITGRSFLSRESKPILDKVLQDHRVIHFDDFSVNPKLEDIEKGMERYRESGAETILAVGGGSALDVAKAIRILAAQSSPDHATTVRTNSAPDPLSGLLIGVPTTTGTGAESTHFAVIYVEGTKFSLAHPDGLPQVAVLDPRTVASLPAPIIAATGMDAIAQAIESYWSIHSTDASREYSRDALKQLIPAIIPAVVDHDADALSCMLVGANLAGRAINIARTTACHAVSYPITTKYGIPHGHAVALTLPSFMEFNAEGTEAEIQDPRGPAHVQTCMSEIFGILGVATPSEAKEKLEAILDTIGLERHLDQLGIDSAGIDYIVENGFNPQRVKNNPRHLSESQLREILHRL